MLRKKSPVTRPGIDPETFQLVVQRLNHYATPDPFILHFYLLNKVGYVKVIFSIRFSLLCFYIVSAGYVIDHLKKCSASIFRVRAVQGLLESQDWDTMLLP